MRGRDFHSELKSILKSEFSKFSFRKFRPKQASKTVRKSKGDSDVGDNGILVTL